MDLIDDQIEETMQLKSQLDLLVKVHDDFNTEYEQKMFEGLDSVVETIVDKDKAHSSYFVQKRTLIKSR